MLIGGWNIEEAGARQFNVVWGYHGITPHSEWNQNSEVPVFADATIGFKPLQIVIVVKEPGGRESIRESVSKILTHLIKPAEIILDGMEHKFYGYLKSYTVAETSKKRFHALTLNMEGYEYGDEVEVSGMQAVEAWNGGTIPAPMQLTLTVPSGLSSLTITGLDDPVTLTGISSGGTILIDSENGIVKKGTALLPTSFLRFPRIPTGVVNISCDNASTSVHLVFKPRFM